MTKLSVACVQLNVGPNLEENMHDTAQLIKEAAAKGASFIATPENTCRMRNTVKGRVEESWIFEEHPAIEFYSKLAKELSVHLLIGSISSIRVGAQKFVNRSLLFEVSGNIKAQYDKIHLFQADLPNGETYKESNIFEGGNKAVVTDVEDIKIGMTICYDMRFPKLYRDLAQKGAKILMTPSAFTVPTGKAHWETLLRARAIENGCFVMAPAQTGTHMGGVKTWGHSLIVAPWGEVIAQAGADTGIIMADLDLSLVDKARTSISSLSQDQDYAF